MTEKELREGLKSYLDPAGLPDSRKEALLRQIRAASPPANEKGETAMFRPNKFRTVLVLAAIVTVLSFTVALAAGLSGYVNIKGERVDMPDIVMAEPTAEPPHLTPTEEPELDYSALTDNILQSAPEEYLVVTSYVEGESTHGSGRDLRITVETYEQLAQLVGDESLMLPIPEGFEFRPGSATLSCPADSAFELVSEEITPEGITVRMYSIPEGEAVVSSYNYNLRNANGNFLGVLMDLSMSEATYLYHVSEEDVAETIALPGMEDALLITRPDEAEVYARRPLVQPIGLWTNSHLLWESEHAIDTYDTVTFNIYSWGKLVPSDWDETVLFDTILSLFTE